MRAATESVAQIVAENKRITVVPSYMTSLVLVFIIKPADWIAKVRDMITKNATIVPRIPKIEIYAKFSKIFAFLRLYPPSKMMGGNSP